MKTESYAGLTTADKPALLDAKARGAEWAARDGDDYSLYFYIGKPYRSCCGSYWACVEVKDSQCIAANRLDLPFIQWSDAEPVNIDLALAQIAEMELTTNSTPLTWNERINQMTVEEKAKYFVMKKWVGYGSVYIAIDNSIHDRRKKAETRNAKFLASPYTEGEKK